MPAPQIVPASEVLAAAGAGKPITQGTYLQRTGRSLAVRVGTVILLPVFTSILGYIFGTRSRDKEA